MSAPYRQVPPGFFPPCEVQPRDVEQYELEIAQTLRQVKRAVDSTDLTLNWTNVPSGVPGIELHHAHVVEQQQSPGHRSRGTYRGYHYVMLQYLLFGWIQMDSDIHRYSHLFIFTYNGIPHIITYNSHIHLFTNPPRATRCSCPNATHSRIDDHSWIGYS